MVVHVTLEIYHKEVTDVLFCIWQIAVCHNTVLIHLQINY